MLILYTQVEMDTKKILETYKNWLTPTEKDELKDREIIYYLNTTFKQWAEYTEDNRLKLNHDDQIDYRYQVLEELGKGAFSNVYRCVDHKYDEIVAMKVIKNNRRYQRYSLIEYEIYDLFQKSDKKNDNVIKLLKVFRFRDDLFISFETYGNDLYHYYKKNDTKDDVKYFGRQIANGLAYIHSFGVVHLDLKPENILIKNKRLKIIDFGSSFLLNTEKKQYKEYVQSRYYRAPEMLFRAPFNTKSDIWSFGCILYELYTQRPLIPARRTSDLAIYYFHILDYPNLQHEWIYHDDKYINPKNLDLISYVTCKKEKLVPGSFSWDLIDKKDDELRRFIIENCLRWECENRISAENALQHPYFLMNTTEV